MDFEKEFNNMFFRAFQKEYGFILEHNGQVSGLREASDWTESNFEKLLFLIRPLVALRGDGIDTSNEKAAIGFVCESMGIVDKI